MKNKVPMKDTITVSRETFCTLLAFAKREQTICDNNARNALKKVEELSNDIFWQDSVNFWRQESQNAQNAYRKALEEAETL